MPCNLLDEPLISVAPGGMLTLPELLAALARDEVEGFPRLRFHQVHGWHALLVQLGAIALLAAGQTDIPTGAGDWASLLRALTLGHPDDAPWSLIAPPDRPAFLQAPVAGVGIDAFKPPVLEPDAIDLLVAARNHESKAARMTAATPEDWLYALVMQQTMGAFLGAGNYGVSRMNGGFSARACVALAVSDRPGPNWCRDLAALVSLAPDLGEGNLDGRALVWLKPWDGATALDFAELHPCYIEICRRLRLVEIDRRIGARTLGSSGPRIHAKELLGNVGDPWIPVEVKDGKAFHLTGNGFSYKVLQRLWFSGDYRRAPLARFRPGDPDDGIRLIARGIAGGQGKTEGWHERSIPVPKEIGPFLANDDDLLGRLSAQRVEQASLLAGSVLYPALACLRQAGRIERAPPGLRPQLRPWLDRFDAAVDQRFFAELWKEITASADARDAVRLAWLRQLAAAARTLLTDAAAALPQAGNRHYKAVAEALRLFNGQLFKHFEQLRTERPADDKAA